MLDRGITKRLGFLVLCSIVWMAAGLVAAVPAASGLLLAAADPQEPPDPNGAKEQGPQPPPGSSAAQSSAEADEKFKSLQAAIRKALEAVKDVHYVPYEDPNAQARIHVREQAWRDDMAGNSPCVTGYSRARPLVLAFAKELEQQHLIDLLDRSMVIAESPELLAALIGEEEHARARAFTYNPMLILEAVYNLSPDPTQKNRALDAWMQAEMKRVEDTLAGRKAELERIQAKPAEERTKQETLNLDFLLNAQDEPIRSIPVWE